MPSNWLILVSEKLNSFSPPFFGRGDYSTRLKWQVYAFNSFDSNKYFLNWSLGTTGEVWIQATSSSFINNTFLLRILNTAVPHHKSFGMKKKYSNRINNW
jgi:hypothetical protein